MSIRYTSGSVRIAFDVVGAGPETLVVTPGWVSHLEYDWATEEIRTYYQRLARGRRLVRFDKRGSGLSDRPTGPETYQLDNHVADLEAVLDAAGVRRAALLGWSQSGPISIAFAAAHPERVSHLVLYGTYPRLLAAPDYPHGRDPKLSAALVDLVRAQWGLGSRALAALILPEADGARLAWFTGYQRIATSPQAAADFLLMNSETDVRALLPRLRVPTLVLHRRDDCLVRLELGACLADQVAGARLQVLEGEQHLPYLGDSAAVADAVAEFLRQHQGGEPETVREELTGREREVLRLLADGIRNREIASRLGISAATVGRHLANIYGKLGVSTRAAAATLALRQRLF